MIKHLLLSLCCIAFFISCSSDQDEAVQQVSITLNFTHNWDGTAVTNSNFSAFDFENKVGNVLSIERLRYLVSDVTLTNSNGEETVFPTYKLVDLSQPDSLQFEMPDKILEGQYSVAFTFGFDTEDNIDGAYADLNTASWNVPENLNGGYHFMQLDGQFKDSILNKVPYNFHAIQAYKTETNTDGSVTETTKNTFFEVSLGTLTLRTDTTIEVQMNIAEWFKTPHDWDLNELSTNLMGNYDAQVDISDNGTSVFSIGTVSP
jgi:hypothetical protein